MTVKHILGILIIIGISSCAQNSKKENTKSKAGVTIVEAMQNVMWKGQLKGKVALDTIFPREHLYGLGPESYLTGELLIKNGEAFVSRVALDTTMIVSKTFKTSAPFFVYGYINDFEKITLPNTIRTIKDVEKYVDEHTKSKTRPFAFVLKGFVKEAKIHVQNLPKGSKVTSPKEAHQGQVNYTLLDKDVEIVGFFSTKHHGVFTHHDANVHLHLITADETMMGHLDNVVFGKMELLLPKD